LTDAVVTVLTAWLGFLGLAVLIGGLVVDLLVLPTDGADLNPIRARLQFWRMLAIVDLILATMSALVLRTLTMTGGDLASATAALPAVLTRTHFGTIWTARLLALGLVLLVSFANSTRLGRWPALLLGVGIALTTSLSGHAADWGDLTLSAGIDWVHVLAASVWTGGLFSLALVVLVDARHRPPRLLGVLARRFSRLAACALAVVVLSGSYNAWVQLTALSALWLTPYGRVLGLKVLVVLGLVWWGAVNRYTVVPRLDRGHAAGVGARLFRLGRLVVRGSSRPARSILPARLLTYVRREAVLAVIIFACTAVLIDLTPGRHALHLRHRVEDEPVAVHVTMSELHASGGVPKGWRFTPPLGDPARGREVFGRLGCFACHTVSGESFPPSSAAGPDLSDVGAHHPAGYLLESIINPNAIIVDGPGYMTPDGRSVMPDVDKNMSVAEVIDLVAFLSNLRAGPGHSSAKPGQQ
jgi:putative copper resistance protein D